MTAGVLFGLIICNLIWSLNPVAGKILLAHFSPPAVAWLRHSSAALAFVLLASASRFLPRGRRLSRFRTDHLMAIPRKGRVRDWKLIVAGAFLTFCFSPLAQTTGLNASHASDNALIVAIEPLATVALAAIFLGERLPRSLIACFALALGGFVLLSGLGSLDLSGEGDHLLGNLLILLAVIAEGSYSSLGRKLIARYSPVEVFGSVMITGVGLLTLALVLFHGGDTFLEIMNPAHWSRDAVFAMLWVGPLGTTLTYLYWMILLRDVSVSAMALTLFVQPVCGAIFGVLLLHEKLAASQILGAGLILAALIAQLRVQRNASKPLAAVAQ